MNGLYVNRRNGNASVSRGLHNANVERVCAILRERRGDIKFLTSYTSVYSLVFLLRCLMAFVFPRCPRQPGSEWKLFVSELRSVRITVSLRVNALLRETVQRNERSFFVPLSFVLFLFYFGREFCRQNCIRRLSRIQEDAISSRVSRPNRGTVLTRINQSLKSNFVFHCYLRSSTTRKMGIAEHFGALGMSERGLG